ncbi:hypothetical protein C8J57DRAFT_1243284 [Mycena rebaudengoi]|nr:hypothetical protein C8J57DRAFT_1243284 [Mycena rebaudengoi]
MSLAPCHIATHPDGLSPPAASLRVTNGTCSKCHQLNHAKPGFTGNAQATSSGRIGDMHYWVEEKGFTVFKWDGSMSFVLVDTSGCIIAALPGKSTNSGWDEDIEWMAEVFKRERVSTVTAFTSKDLHHRHGNFVCINSGCSHGSGQLHPGMLHQSHVCKAQAAERLCADPAVNRVAVFQSTISPLQRKIRPNIRKKFAPEVAVQ